jgi:hypothetical protein
MVQQLLSDIVLDPSALNMFFSALPNLVTSDTNIVLVGKPIQVLLEALEGLEASELAFLDQLEEQSVRHDIQPTALRMVKAVWGPNVAFETASTGSRVETLETRGTMNGSHYEKRRLPWR